MKKTLFLSVVFFSLLILGCKEPLLPIIEVDPDPAPVMELSFNIFPPSILEGDSAEISWNTNGLTCTLNGAYVDPNGDMMINPTVTTTYTLVSFIGETQKSDSRTIEVEPIPTKVDTLCSFGPWIQFKAETKSYFDPDFIWREYEFSGSYVGGKLTFTKDNGRYEYVDSKGVLFGDGDWSIVNDSLYRGGQFPYVIDTLNKTTMVLTMKMESYDGPKGLTFVGYSYLRLSYRH